MKSIILFYTIVVPSKFDDTIKREVNISFINKVGLKDVDIPDFRQDYFWEGNSCRIFNYSYYTRSNFVFNLSNIYCFFPEKYEDVAIFVNSSKDIKDYGLFRCLKEFVSDVEEKIIPFLPNLKNIMVVHDISGENFSNFLNLQEELVQNYKITREFFNELVSLLEDSNNTNSIQIEHEKKIFWRSRILNVSADSIFNDLGIKKNDLIMWIKVNDVRQKTLDDLIARIKNGSEIVETIEIRVFRPRDSVENYIHIKYHIED